MFLNLIYQPEKSKETKVTKNSNLLYIVRLAGGLGYPNQLVLPYGGKHTYTLILYYNKLPLQLK